MNPDLPLEAVELGAAARRAFGDLGGVDLARRAEDDPTLRTSAPARALGELGIDEIDPRADAVSLAAAAALCCEAGRVALPYPVAAAVLRDGDGRPSAAVAVRSARVDHGDLFAHWRVGTLGGVDGGVAVPAGAALGTRLGPFVTALTVDTSAPAADPLDVLLHLTLTAWSVLGTVERAVELAVTHVRDRVQFGKPLAAFQAVQFQLADAAVAAAGLRELAAFTLWRVGERGDEARADVLALRLHALEVARAVLRTSQQLHGAAGVCDEYDVSVLTRMVQPALRLPAGIDRTVTDLAATIAGTGFDGLFAHGAAAS